MVLVPVLSIFSNVALYVAEYHSAIFHSSAFRFGYPALCGVLVFLGYLFPDKYFSSKWGSLGAKAT